MKVNVGFLNGVTLTLETEHDTVEEIWDAYEAEGFVQGKEQGATRVRCYKPNVIFIATWRPAQAPNSGLAIPKLGFKQ